MIEKFQEIEARFEEVERKMSDPEVISDQQKYRELGKKHSELRHGVDIFRDYMKLLESVSQAKEMLGDTEMADMAKEEIDTLTPKLEKLELELKMFLVPKDPNDSKNVICEIRSGTGGEEAALFANELFTMYSRFAESKNWAVEVLSQNLTDMGGIKEISFEIKGNAAYSYLKFESGTHRVQRVPATESQGRVHTSAATVAILPEAEEVDVEIETKDLRIDTYRASGAGGQHVNKTSSAIRITHIPSGVVVACQDERSQFQNKDKAMKVLRSRLYEKALMEQRSKNSELRKGQVGSGDRSEKIRTYNFPQNRVTDHRINLSLHSLDQVLAGKMNELVEALRSAELVEKMKQ